MRPAAREAHQCTLANLTVDDALLPRIVRASRLLDLLREMQNIISYNVAFIPWNFGPLRAPNGAMFSEGSPEYFFHNPYMEIP